TLDHLEVLARKPTRTMGLAGTLDGRQVMRCGHSFSLPSGRSSRSELLRAALPATPQLCLTALAQCGRQPYDVVALERPQSTDHFTCFDPCTTVPHAEAEGARNKAL